MIQKLQGTFLVLGLLISAGISAQSLKGTSWQASVGGSVIEIHFTVGDTMSIKPAGSGLIDIASYQLSGDTVTITDFNPASTGCPTPGVYTYSIQNNILTMTVVSDNCADRANFVTGGGGTWTQMGIGLSESKPNSIANIYPVPTNDILHVDLIEAAELEYSIISISGQVLVNGFLTRASNEVDLKMLPGGIYFLSIPQLGKPIRISKN